MIPVGPDPDRIAQVRVRPSFGTGYLIGPGLVLTAAHVVMTATGERPPVVTVYVPGLERTDGDVVWFRKDERVDAALIRITLRDGGRSTRRAPTTRYGSFVSAEPDQRIEAIGFPRLQKYESLRDQEHFAGLLSPATGAVSGHYEFTSTTPLPGPVLGEATTPWAGMSGAAVFSAGLLVGIVRSDRRAQSGARLTATPMAELLADETFRLIVGEVTGWDPVCEPVELSGFLESPYPNRDVRSVASLLRADTEAVMFHGREAELERLDAWCTGPAQTAAMIITGQGGDGKSRLARRFLGRHRARGWTVGFLRPALVDDAATEERFISIARTRGPLLIAVDYAENHPRQVRALLRQARAAHGPVRILLLARERGGWAEALDEPDARVRDLLAEASQLALASLASTAGDWDASFRQAVRDFAQALRTLPGHEEPDWPAVAEQITPPPEDTHRRPGSVLGIQMTALTLLLQEATPVDAVGGELVERTLLRHEEAYWTRAAQRCGLRGLDRTTLRSAVAALYLVTVVDRTQAIRLIDALGIRDTDRGRIVARWLRELYPQAEDVYVGCVQPDRLAEFLLVEASAEERDLLTKIVSAAADCGVARRLAHVNSDFGGGSAAMFSQMMALQGAVRAARSQAHFGNPVRPLLDQIERTASQPVISDETLAWTVSNILVLPTAERRQDIRENADGSHTITGMLDAASAALEVAGYRRGAHAMSQDDPRQQGFVHMLHSLALRRLGRVDEALAVCAQSVDCFRSVPEAEQDLANQLHYQAELLLRLGREAEATEPLREEVVLRASTDPHQDALPPALDLLITTLCRTGQTAQARSFAYRETELLRPSSTGPTQGQARAYVRSLGRYAEILNDGGDLSDALECCRRIDVFLAGLPAATADGLTGDRAALAGLRAQILGDTGDQAGGVIAWLESAALWQRLDAPYHGEDPVVRAVESLNNAAVGHAACGNHAKALDVIREAVELALGERGESLRRDRPELYEQVHATYVGYLVDGGRPEDALREAERLWNRPAQSSTPLPPSFAHSMREASLAVGAAGRLAEAVRASGIAVATLRAFDVPTHDLHLSMLLAITLTDHAANLAVTGEGKEGAEAGAQAAEVWRRVCAGEPQLRINLVFALANQAECLRLDARYADAGRVFVEAAEVLRKVTRDSPQDRPMLADLLSGQAFCQFAAGLHEAAARARAEEVQLRRELWKTDPSAGAKLAKAYSELAVLHEKLNRSPDAMAAAEHALEIFDHLYGPGPAPNWLAVARALLVCGTVLLKSGRAVDAVAPFARAMAMAIRMGDMDFAASCRSGIDLAGAADPVGVAAEWRRLVSTDDPGPTSHRRGPVLG